MKINTTRDRSSLKELFSRLDSICMRAVDAVKEAFFPRRCLICGSFYRVEEPFPNSSKSVLRALNRGELNAFISDTSFKVHNRCGDTFEYGWRIEENTFATVMAPFLCIRCSGTFLTVESPICSSCGMVFKSRFGEDHLCGECISAPKRYRIARSAGIYDKVLMAAIHCLKYNGKIQLARPLGVLLYFIFRRYWNENRPDLILPVPLHSKKLRHRGFNPSLLLVSDWASIAKAFGDGFPVLPVAEDILIRTKWTISQTGLGRKERLKNIKNAFSVNEPSRIKGKKILLIDDVYTTGATVDECAKVLAAAGASHVDVLTLARAM